MNPVPVPALAPLAFEHRATSFAVPLLPAMRKVDATAVAHADTSRRAPRWGA
ncbi:hypothetical protein [Streptomyces xylophagus]|uniref:hypothetical protein n=1 Tax=Streptomyces xylophagus TaxID=285514 RepID=UPI000A80BAEE|nr:hypothetical protein [Streptomyces xylophagus]